MANRPQRLGWGLGWGQAYARPRPQNITGPIFWPYPYTQNMSVVMYVMYVASENLSYVLS